MNEEKGFSFVEIATSFEGSPEDLLDAVCTYAQEVLVEHRNSQARN